MSLAQAGPGRIPAATAAFILSQLRGAIPDFNIQPSAREAVDQTIKLARLTTDYSTHSIGIL